MTGTFCALFWCHCVNFSLSFYHSIILKGSMAFFSCKHCTLPTTLEMSEINNQLLHFPTMRIKCRLMCWKCPAENAGNGISKTLNLKIFWGSRSTQVPQKITKAEMCLTNITDAVFYTVANRLPLCQETKYFKRFFSFLQGFILSDLEAIVGTVFLTCRQTCDRSDRSDHMETRL